MFNERYIYQKILVSKSFIGNIKLHWNSWLFHKVGSGQQGNKKLESKKLYLYALFYFLNCDC